MPLVPSAPAIPETNGLPLTEYTACPSPPLDKLGAQNPLESKQSAAEEALGVSSNSSFIANSEQHVAASLSKIAKSIASSQVPEAFLLPDGHPDVGYS